MGNLTADTRRSTQTYCLADLSAVSQASAFVKISAGQAGLAGQNRISALQRTCPAIAPATADRTKGCLICCSLCNIVIRLCETPPSQHSVGGGATVLV